MKRFTQIFLSLSMTMLFSSCRMDPDALFGAQAGKEQASGTSYQQSPVNCSEKAVGLKSWQDKEGCLAPTVLEDTLAKVETLSDSKLKVILVKLSDGQVPKLSNIRYRLPGDVPALARSLKCKEQAPTEDPIQSRAFVCHLEKAATDTSTSPWIFHSIELVNEKCGASAEYLAVFNGAGCTEDAYAYYTVSYNVAKSPVAIPRLYPGEPEKPLRAMGVRSENIDSESWEISPEESSR